MSNGDISRISGNLIPKEKIGTAKEVDHRKSENKLDSNPQSTVTPPADVTISEEGIRRLEASKNKNIESSLDPENVLGKIKEDPKSMIKAHTAMSPGKVADLLKD